MRIGIVTTWFERGAAYVSKQFEEVLSEEHEVFIYARGGEKYGIGNPKWDKDNVTWGTQVWLPTVTTPMDKRDFLKWVKENDIEAVLFNEQHWWLPLIWCKEEGITTLAYIDYYKENTLKFYEVYDYLICNTKRHYKAFSWHTGARYIPWGTDVSVYSINQTEQSSRTFFHSVGMAPFRKGTDILLKAFSMLDSDWKLVIHTQVPLEEMGSDFNLNGIINGLKQKGKLKIINESVSAPGLYHLGEVYLYPSRLDGIGLTVAESMACGLIPILPNNPPMNEFVPDDYKYLVPVNKFYSRSDGYYWPIGEVEPNDLLKKMKAIIELSDKERLMLRNDVRSYAEEKLSWEKNTQQLLLLFRNIKAGSKTIDPVLKDKIIKFSNHGFKKLNSIILKFNPIIRPVVRQLKKISK